MFSIYGGGALVNSINGGRVQVNETSLSSVLAALIALTLPIRAVVPVGDSILSIGVMLSSLVLPVLLFRAFSYRYLSTILTLIGGALASAPLLIYLSGRDVVNKAAIASTLALAFAAISLVALLWVRSEIGIRRACLWFAIGLLIQGLLIDTSSTVNSWKFVFAFPVALLLLVAASATESIWPTTTLLLAVAIYSVLNGYRSFAMICLLVLALFCWNRTSRVSVTGLATRKRIGALIAFAGFAFVAYRVGIWLALQGYLGERNYLVTMQQSANSESVLAAGRPENSAAWELFIRQPIGFGPGVLANSEDISIGKTALMSRGVDVDTSSITDYVLGAPIKLHSVISDLWVQFGLFGLILGASFLWIIASGVIRAINEYRTPAVIFFLGITCVWNLLFSPIQSNLHEVVIAIAMLIPLNVAVQTRGWRATSLGRGRTRAVPPMHDAAS